MCRWKLQVYAIWGGVLQLNLMTTFNQIRFNLYIRQSGAELFLKPAPARFDFWTCDLFPPSLL